MNDFSDAFRQGETIKQKQDETQNAQQRSAADKLQRGIDDAKKWMERCVDPVVEDARAGLTDKGKVLMQDTSNPPSQPERSCSR